MKRFLLIALAGVMTNAFATGTTGGIVEDDDITGFRVGGILDLEGDKDGDPILGFTVGVGENIYPLDEMILSFSHLASDNIDQTGLTISIEERYTSFDNFRPYARAGVGYLWVNDDMGVDPDGVFFELAGGVILPFGPSSRLYAEAIGQWSGDDLWLDDEEFEANNVQFAAGLRIYY